MSFQNSFFYVLASVLQPACGMDNYSITFHQIHLLTQETPDSTFLFLFIANRTSPKVVASTEPFSHIVLPQKTQKNYKKWYKDML